MTEHENGDKGTGSLALADTDDLDMIAVERACAGDHSVSLSRAEAMAAWKRLEDRDHSAKEISDLLGVHQREVVRWRNGHCAPIALKAGRNAMTAGNGSDALYRAQGIADRRIQRAATKARDALALLGGLLDEWEAKAEARARIEELEEELAEAKAALRAGRPSRKPVVNTHPTTPRAPRGAPENCPKCGKECANPQGRAAHERHCSGVALESVG